MVRQFNSWTVKQSDCSKVSQFNSKRHLENIDKNRESGWAFCLNTKHKCLFPSFLIPTEKKIKF